MRPGLKVRDFEERFWARVDRRGPTDCWNWTGASRTRKGYGVIKLPGQRRNTMANRAAYMLAVGPIQAGMFVCHHCDNPSCCNPAHLFVGSNYDNVQDMVSKGRNRRGENSCKATLKESEVLHIRALAKAGLRHCEVSRLTGVDQANVLKIVLRQRWRHI